MEDAKLDGLSPAQHIALREILAGKSITSAAEAAGATRPTVSRWMNHDPAFIRALRELQQEPLNEAREALKRLAVDAVEALGAILNDPLTCAADRIRAAAQILRACGLVTAGNVAVAVGAVGIEQGNLRPLQELSTEELQAIRTFANKKLNSSAGSLHFPELSDDEREQVIAMLEREGETAPAPPGTRTGGQADPLHHPALLKALRAE